MVLVCIQQQENFVGRRHQIWQLGRMIGAGLVHKKLTLTLYCQKLESLSYTTAAIFWVYISFYAVVDLIGNNGKTSEDRPVLSATEL